MTSGAIPSAPAAPTISNVKATTLTSTAPAFPAGAQSLKLDKKLSTEADTAYVNVATGLAAGAVTNVTSLTPATTYVFRYSGVSGGASTPGATASAKTLALPGVANAPAFSVVHATSLIVTAPALPSNSTSLSLQSKLSTDSSYTTIATGQAAASTKTVTALLAATAYDFRYQGVGVGGTTDGTSARVSTASRPTNDNFASAQLLAGGSGTVTGTNAEATRETSEPVHNGQTTSTSVWYRWTPTQSGSAFFQTYGSSFYTVLAVYTGSAINALVPVASSGNSANAQSRVTFAVTAGTEYKIAVDGLNGAIGSVSLSWGAYVPAPAPPTSFNAAPGDGKVTLSWDPTPRATSYTLYRYNEDYSNATLLASPVPPTTSYVDTVANGINWIYKLTATNSEGSALAFAYARSGTGFPAPVLFSLKDAAGTGTITCTLSWYASPGAVSYKVYRRVAGGVAGASIADVTGGATTWTDAPQPSNQSYYYGVRAVDANGNLSLYSNELRVLTTAPGYVSNFRAQPGDGRVYLSWDPVEGATGYNITRYILNAAGTSYSYDSSWSSSLSSYTDSGVSNGQTYAYYVYAQNRLGSGGQASIQGVRPGAAPPVPTGLSATGFADRIELSWAASTGATSYSVWRSTTAGGPYTNIATVYAPTLSATDSSVIPGSTYFYVVQASIGQIASSFSPEVSASVLAPGLSFFNVQATSLSVQLPPLPRGATSYKLFRSVQGVPTAPPATGLRGWWRGDAVTGHDDGDAVDSWLDFSGNGLHGRAFSGQNRPRWKAGVIGGRAALRFDGKANALRLPPGLSDFSKGLSAFAVFRSLQPPSEADAYNRLFELIGANSNRIVLGNGLNTQFGYMIDDIGVQMAASLPRNGWQIASVVHQAGAPGTATGVSLFLNGQSRATGSLTVPANALRDNSYLGNNAVSDRGFNGDIAEILIYDTAQTPDARAQIEGYLARSYSLPQTLSNLTQTPAFAWTQIATGMAGGSRFDDTALAPNTTYWYRTEAVITSGTTNTTVSGVPSNVTTTEIAPVSAPAAAFSNVRINSVTVSASPATWPANASILKLQGKKASDPPSAYRDFECRLASAGVPLPVEVKGLEPATKYSFRWVAQSNGGAFVGSEAAFTTASMTSGAGGGLLGTYYAINDFQRPVFSRIDPQVDFYWPIAGPSLAMSGDNFSIRWAGQIQAAYSENYVLHFPCDDTAKVFLNGQKIIDGAIGVAGSTDSAPIALVAGQKYDIQIDYQEYSGGATARLQWESPSQPLQAVPSDRLFAPTGDGTGLRGQYFKGPSFNSFAFSRIDPSLNFGWPARGIDPRVDGGALSVWWTGQVKPGFSGIYTFTTSATATANVRLWVNGQQLIDANNTTKTGTISLNAGQLYSIQLAYSSNTQGAPVPIVLEWQSAGQPRQSVPFYCLYPAISDSTPPAGLFSYDFAARFVSHTLPSQLPANVPTTATVVFRNSGAAIWTSARIRLVESIIVAGVSQRQKTFPIAADVPPGGTVSFAVDVTPSPLTSSVVWQLEDFSNIANLVAVNDGYRAAVTTTFASLPLTVMATTSNSALLKLPALPSGASSFRLERTTAATGNGVTSESALPATGRMLWWKADSLTALDEGDPVTSWKSVTGTGVATQNDSNIAPRLSFKGPQGRPVVSFNGRAGALNTDVVGPGGSGISLFTVVKAPSIRAYQSIVRYEDGNGFFIYPNAEDYGRSAAVYMSNDSPSMGGGFVVNDWNIGEASWSSGGLFSTWRNGQLVAQRAANTSTLPSALLAIGQAGNRPEQFFGGDLAEALIYNRALSDAERKTVEAYLSHKYGLRVADSIVPSTWATVATGLPGSSFYEDKTLSPATVYWYRVVALNGSGAALTTGDPVIASTRPLPPTAPDAPGVPASGVVTATSITVTAPGPALPARADALILQVKLPTQLDSDYADVGKVLGAGETRVAASLTPETTYRFRFVAVGAGGRTPSALFADYTTTALPPEAPERVQMADLLYGGGQYSVVVTMPMLPARADSLRLEWRIGTGATFAPFALGAPQPGVPSASPSGGGLDGQSVVTVNGLVLTQYDGVELRAVAVGAGGEAVGPGVTKAPADLAPGIADPPQFTLVGSNEVEVLSPALPVLATSLVLQMHLLSEADAPWINVQQNVSAGQKTPVSNLARGTSYGFRYLALGANGQTTGQEASLTLPLTITLWRAASAVECRGIRWPLAGTSIAKGTTGQVRAFAATDFDARDILSAAGVRTDRFTDLCTYSWSCDNVCFAGGGGFDSSGTRTQTVSKQSPMFVAPTTPGTYTLSLVVDDQGSANIGNGEAGTRDGREQGFQRRPP